MKKKKLTVCANVVTFNRKELLLECLSALLSQTRKPDAIYIIDNASTDNTECILKSSGYIEMLPPKVLTECWHVCKNFDGVLINYVKMVENMGGSGGQYEGMKRAYDDGYDWIWIMDDDGYPVKDCLMNLLKHSSSGDFLAALVVDKLNTANLTFGFYNPEDNKMISTTKQACEISKDGEIFGVAQPFNGVMLNRTLVEKIGFPKRDMFIWGDEMEYLARAKHHKARLITVVSSLHKHPVAKVRLNKTLFGWKHVKYTGVKLKDYCYFRNTAYWTKKYSIMTLFKMFFLYSYFFVVTRLLDINGYVFFLKAYCDGMIGRFDKHRQYLPK